MRVLSAAPYVRWCIHIHAYGRHADLAVHSARILARAPEISGKALLHIARAAHTSHSRPASQRSYYVRIIFFPSLRARIYIYILVRTRIYMYTAAVHYTRVCTKKTHQICFTRAGFYSIYNTAASSSSTPALSLPFDPRARTTRETRNISYLSRIKYTRTHARARSSDLHTRKGVDEGSRKKKKKY